MIVNGFDMSSRNHTILYPGKSLEVCINGDENIKTVSEIEIPRVIAELSVNTASGADGFSSRIIKSALYVFIPIITKLIEISIDISGHIKKKRPCVILIYKLGDDIKHGSRAGARLLPEGASAQ